MRLIYLEKEDLMPHQVPQDSVQADTLIQVYNAALDPSEWVEAIDRCVNHVGAASASVMSIDTLNPAGYTVNVMSNHIRTSATEEKLNYWLTELAKYDGEGHHIALRYPALSVFSDIDIWSNDSQLDQRPDYVFLREEFGIRRKIAARLSDNRRYIDAVGFHFPAVWEKPAEIHHRNLAQLVPHVAKAVEMGNLYDKLQKQHAAVLTALDHVGIGLVVLAPTGHVIVSNLEAKRILESGHGIRHSVENKLVYDTSANTVQLNNSIRDAAISKQQTVAERILSLRKTKDANPLIIEISPLRDHLQEINASTDSVLVQLIDVDCHQHCVADAFVKAFGLTDAEAAVTQLVLEGMTNQEIADSRNTSAQTVKSQISSLMRKAGVQSRVQLVRLVLKTDPPIHQ